MAENYLETVARMRMERSQRETVGRLQEIAREYQQVQRERDEAFSRGDRDSFELADSDCQRLEQDWNYLNPPQAPQADPRAVEFLERNRSFLERHGAAAAGAIKLAHEYATRPRNTQTSNPAYTGMGLTPMTPAYFNAMRDLLQMYSKDFGLHYDRNEESITATEAAKISGLSPRAYNNSVRAVAAERRFMSQQTNR